MMATPSIIRRQLRIGRFHRLMLTLNHDPTIRYLSIGTFRILVEGSSNLSERSEKQATAELPIVLELVLKKNSPIIDFNLTVDNQAVDSHRVCVLFDTGITSKFSIADQQFGTLQRPVVFEKEMALWEATKSNGMNSRSPSKPASLLSVYSMRRMALQ